MLRFGAAIARHKKIPAFFSSDDADILRLRFRAFADTAGYRHFNFMRRPQSFIPVFYFNSKAHRVVQSIPAPGRANAAFHRAHRFAVSMAAFKSRRDQLFPDLRQLMDMGSEEINALSPGNFTVEVIFFSHLPDHDQLVRRDLASGYAGHHGVSTSFLNISEVPVIGILDNRLPEHGFIPGPGENGSNRRLTYLAAPAPAEFFQRRLISFKAIDLYQVK